MREIKFRAWDGKHWTTLGMYHGTENGLSVFGISQHEGIILMQFTGLQDKNGKEIYEGDVCRILYTDWPSKWDDTITLEQHKVNLSHIGKVVYNAPEFELEFNPKERFYTNTGSIIPGTHGELEVIGNIYENPKLLTP